MPTALEGICFLSEMQTPLMWAREVTGTLTEHCGLQYPRDQHVPRFGPRLFRNMSLSILHPELVRAPLCKCTNRMLILLCPPIIAPRQMEQMSVLAAHVPGDTARARVLVVSTGIEREWCPGTFLFLMTIPDTWTDPSPVAVLSPPRLACPSFRILQKQVLCMRLSP